MNKETVRYAIWVENDGIYDTEWELNFTTTDLKVAEGYYKNFHWHDKKKPLHKKLTVILKDNDGYR